jgi:hypothetical protein
MQVFMKNTTCTLITKIGLGERVKREYSKTQKNPVEVTLSSNTIMNWRNHQLSRDCADWEVEMGSSGGHVAPDPSPTNGRQMPLPFNYQDRGDCNGKGCLERTPDKIFYLNAAAQRNPRSQKGSGYLDHLSCAPSPERIPKVTSVMRGRGSISGCCGDC